MFSYLKSGWTHIFLEDVQRKDKRQKKEFSLRIRVFHSESTLAQKYITDKLCHLCLWWSQKLDLGTALGNLQSSPCFLLWGIGDSCAWQQSVSSSSAYSIILSCSQGEIHLHKRKRPRWAASASTALVGLKVATQLVWRSWYPFSLCAIYTMCIYSSFKHEL